MNSKLIAAYHGWTFPQVPGVGTWLSLHWDHLHERNHTEGLGRGPIRYRSESHGQQGQQGQQLCEFSMLQTLMTLQPLFRGDTEGWILGDDGLRFCISKRMSNLASEVFFLTSSIFLICCQWNFSIWIVIALKSTVSGASYCGQPPSLRWNSHGMTWWMLFRLNAVLSWICNLYGVKEYIFAYLYYSSHHRQFYSLWLLGIVIFAVFFLQC